MYMHISHMYSDGRGGVESVAACICYGAAIGWWGGEEAVRGRFTRLLSRTPLIACAFQLEKKKVVRLCPFSMGWHLRGGATTVFSDGEVVIPQ